MMKCEVYIPSTILEHTAAIPYKYVVYSARANVNQHPYEFLHESWPLSPEVNRCLQVSQEVLWERGLCAHCNCLCYLFDMIGWS